MALEHAAPAAVSIGTTPATRDHLIFIDGFRAIAIVGVVVGHCFNLAFGSSTGQTSAVDPVLNILSGNTALFVFISGLLFHHVFYQRWEFGKFMMGKLRNVFIPYAVCSLFLLAWASLRGWTPYTHAHHVLGNVENLYVDYTFSLVSGQLGLSLWYIPFIAIVFIASPLFLKFIELSTEKRSMILIAALLVGVLVNRSPYNVDKLQNIAYFSFYYLLGIEVSLRRHAFTHWLERRETLFLLAISLSIISYLEITWQGMLGSYGGWFDLHKPNVHYFQKIALILFCCTIFVRFPSLNNGRMRSLARDSFGIFFVHNLIIEMMASTLGNGVFVTGYKLVDLVLYGAIVLSLSWLVVVTIKRRLGQKSRMLIGA